MSGIRPNDRDFKALAYIGRYGLLDLPLCHSLAFPTVSQERCRQKLSSYEKSGLIKSIKLQVWYAEGRKGGRIPTIYCLTEQGAELLSQFTSEPVLRVLKSDPKPATFFHRLQTVKVCVAFDTSAQHAGLEPIPWIMEFDVRQDAPETLPPSQRFVLYHEFHDGTRTFTCQPDAAGVLKIPNPTRPDQPTELAVLFEIDLSTEGLAQCCRKIPGHTALLERRSFHYWSDLRNPEFRVFWIVPSNRRIEELRAAFRDFTVAEHFFFTTFEHCNQRILTDKVWQDIQGKPRRVLNWTITDVHHPPQS